MATILIVDDRPTNREYLVTLLKYHNHQLLQAADGAEALAIARTEHPDLIIADILMPTMDGYEFVRQLRADPVIANTRVIFCTANYREQEARTLANACAVSAVITKPSDPEVLLDAVASILEQAPQSFMPQFPQEFERDHVRLLTNKLSENVEELRQTNERLSTLLNLSLQLGSEMDLRRLLQNFTHAARDIIGARYAITGILNGSGEPKLRYVFTSGMNAEMAARLGTPNPRAVPLRPILTEGRSSRLQNTKGTPEELGLGSSYPPIHSWLAAPVISPTRVYGWVELIDKIEGETFSEEDERLVSILAAQVGRIYQNSSLYTDVLGHASELEREMSERKRTEEALVAVQRRLQHLVSSSPAVLLTIQIADNRIAGISWISDNVQTQFGYPPAEALDPNWWLSNIHSEDREIVTNQMNTELFAQGSTTQEYRLRHADGEYRWTRGEFRLMRDAKGQPMEAVGSWSDITERKHLEDQVRQAQRMEAIGQLAGGVAHDFNNLLTIISGYSELLIDLASPTDPSREVLGEIKKAAERSAGLTRQLLVFSRQSALAPQILNLNEVIANTEKMLRRVIGEDLRLNTILFPDLWLVRADPCQLEQVIMNLAVNARDAMPTGGQLTIETKNVELSDDHVIKHPEAHSGRHVLLAMTDTGCGMPPTVQARIFEPFFTTKGIGKGTGLGLSVVHGIIRQSGGHVEVQSEVGNGTTFKIYLPQVVDSQESISLKSTSANPPHGNETILLVEDEEGVRTLGQHLLTGNGYTVLPAANGIEAIQIAEHYDGPIHLVITDVVMPQLGGRELAEQLCARYPGLRVLFVSGYTDDDIVRHGIMHDQVNFLQKPYTLATLVRKVREALDEAV